MPNQYAPVTEEDYRRVSELHALGLGRNAIARETGRSQRTVSLIAIDLGLTFDTTMTEDATRARVAQLAEKRALLADALMDDALRLSEQVWQPTTVFNFGGKDNTYAERHVDQPPAPDRKALMAAATQAAAQSLRLVPPTDDTGADDARSMLGKLMTGLQAVYGEQRSAEEEAEVESP